MRILRKISTPHQIFSFVLHLHPSNPYASVFSIRSIQWQIKFKEKEEEEEGKLWGRKKMRRWWRWWKYRENRKWKVKKIRSWMGRKYMTNKTGWAGLMCIHVSLSGNKNCCAIVWLWNYKRCNHGWCFLLHFSSLLLLHLKSKVYESNTKSICATKLTANHVLKGVTAVL